MKLGKFVAPVVLATALSGNVTAQAPLSNKEYIEYINDHMASSEQNKFFYDANVRLFTDVKPYSTVPARKDWAKNAVVRVDSYGDMLVFRIRKYDFAKACAGGEPYKGEEIYEKAFDSGFADLCIKVKGKEFGDDMEEHYSEGCYGDRIQQTKDMESVKALWKNMGKSFEASFFPSHTVFKSDRKNFPRVMKKARMTLYDVLKGFFDYYHDE